MGRFEDLLSELDGFGVPDDLIDDLRNTVESETDKLNEEIQDLARNNDRLYDQLNDYECEYDQSVEIKNIYTCDLIHELSTRRSNPTYKLLFAENLYEMDKLEILEEFNNKYTLRQLQILQDLIKSYGYMYNDFKENLDFDNEHQVAETLKLYMNEIENLYEGLNPRR